MDGIGGQPGWAWIFILEGLVTVICAVASFFILQDFPDTAKFLNETERECFVSVKRFWPAHQTGIGVLVIRRLQSDMKFSASGEKFKMKYVLQSLRDWKTWIASTSTSSPRGLKSDIQLSGHLHGLVGDNAKFCMRFLNPL